MTFCLKKKIIINVIDFKDRNFSRYFRWALALFLIPLGVFYLIYTPVMAWSQDHILQPLYVHLFDKGYDISFIINMRILVKGFIFTVLLALCWFPSTLLMRYLYFRIVEHKRDAGIFDEK